MDSMSIIMGLSIVVLCALPFILMGRGRKKEEKRLLASLRSFAEKQSLTIAEHDFGPEFAIGLSNDAQYVFFTKLSGATELGKYLPLEQVQNCRANTVSRMVGGTNKESVIDRLELAFQPKDPKTPQQTWVFFDANDNLPLSDELDLLRQWEKRLNTVLKENNVSKAVA